MSTELLVETRHSVRTLTLNRPERHNALNDELADAFCAAFAQAVADQEVRAILIAGAGKSFCSGRDTTVLGHRARNESDFEFIRRHQAQRLVMLDCPKPIVAALKGAALGGGCELALAADIRIADATLTMGMPEINYGLLPDTGGTQLLTTLVGASRAKYLVLSGKRIEAATALAWGAVDFIVASDRLNEEALELARALAAKPPMALAMGKQMIDQLHLSAIRAGIGQELLAQTALFRTEDYAEARAAHREQRSPTYRGR